MLVEAPDARSGCGASATPSALAVPVGAAPPSAPAIGTLAGGGSAVGNNGGAPGRRLLNGGVGGLQATRNRPWRLLGDGYRGCGLGCRLSVGDVRRLLIGCAGLRRGSGIRLRSSLQILLGLGTGARGPACRSIGGGFTRSARRWSRDLGVGLRLRYRGRVLRPGVRSLRARLGLGRRGRLALPAGPAWLARNDRSVGRGDRNLRVRFGLRDRWRLRLIAGRSGSFARRR